jgi:hypothetical protein
MDDRQVSAAIRPSAEQEQAGRVRQARVRIDPVHAIGRLAVRLAAAEVGDSGEERPDLRRVPFATRKTRSFPAGGSLLAGARTPYSGGTCAFTV